ncbi:MAG TPA: NAD-dependent epimerase/dehydratase family protein [Vicinamibacteria bacterium]|nr:NAD-dependent epimerase/dehydratase family protein [Vicinamibacteria bacterium]
MGRIALTGTSSFLGSRVLRRLVAARDPDSVLAVDVAAPPASVPGVRYHMVDITLPAADQRLLEAFQEEEVDSVVHTAFFTNPRRDPPHAHELESIGTLHLAAAAAAAGVRHLIVRSFTAVYGAQGQNPNYLTEERTPPPNPGLGWIRDKLEAEGHARSFARRYPRLTVTVLRFAPLLGPGVHTFYTRIFSRRVVPVLLGYDPLLQLLHPDDAVEAVEAALDKAPGGSLNIVPRGVISLLTALHLADKVPLPVPHPVAYAAADLLWSAGLGEAPGGFLDYVRFLCVADGEKAQRLLGFTARHTSRDALAAFLGYRYPEAANQRMEARA